MGKPTTLELLLAKIAGRTVNDVIVLQTKVDHLLAEIAERVNSLLLPPASDDDNGWVPVVQANGTYALEEFPLRVTFSGDEESAAIDVPTERLIRALGQLRPIAWQYEKTTTDENTTQNAVYSLNPVRTTKQIRINGSKRYVDYFIECRAFMPDNPNDVSDSYEFVSARLDLSQNEDGTYTKQASVVFKIT